MNSDRLCVVSGPDIDIEAFSKKLEKEEIPNKLLLTSHAFHSDMMDPILDTFKDEVEKVTLNAPDLPIISTVTGTWLTEAEAQNPEYWTDHLRATVRFTDAMDTILGLEDVVVLEVGPGRVLATLARQKKEAKSLTTISSLPIPKNDEGSYPALLNALGQLWMNGVEPDWQAFYNQQSRQKVNLPSYQFDRKPCWAKHILSKPVQIINPTSIIPQVVAPIHIDNNPKPMRKPIIINKISELINNASGIEIEASDANYSFLELGLDSLILTQIALTCKREFNIPISFRQLNEEFSTPELLASHLDATLPAEVFAQAAPAISQAPVAVIMPNSNYASTGDPNSALNLIAQQLQFLGGQVAALQGNGAMPAPVMETAVAKPVPVQTSSDVLPTVSILTEEEKKEHKKPFGASPRIEKLATDLNKDQQEFLEKLTFSYNEKTKGSKSYSQEHRANMADPRVVSGFKPLTKELIYPLVIKKSSGNKMWDLDGNEYIDVLNGFGSCMFGHQPDFIKEALKEQIESGYEVGPQHPLAGEVCDLLCEFTDHERTALCNTGSEAVLGAMRIARTATGRSLVVAFSGSYHGINDEGLVRGSKKLKTFPAAAGIMPEAVQNMLILEYGTEESLNIIRERADELAAVLVEPVQSRRPEFLPLEFLKEVREITTKSETALIFDEVITGFRVHPGGFQAAYGIKADLAAYGKVIGGGLSIGAILGKREYMDALDGGFWQYGDNSYPEVGVTYFAGTFVRHPLALAASKASLLHMKAKGEHLQNSLTAMTERLAYELNLEIAKRKLPMEVTQFSSLWRLKMNEDVPYSELLFVLLREKGFHIWDGFPCFITEAYTADDIILLIDAILSSLDEMIAAGFFKSALSLNDSGTKLKTPLAKLNKPPVKGARLGKDESGNPAWFIADAKEKNGYVKIDL
jgi:glutamate-1-semialdehyde aminotransferase/acyl carrier protein